MEVGHLSNHGNSWVKNDLSNPDRLIGKFLFKVLGKEMSEVIAHRCGSCLSIELTVKHQ